MMQASVLALWYLVRQSRTAESPENREKFKQLAADMRAKLEAKTKQERP